jgi:YesN/AraC family two-component response regulator
MNETWIQVENFLNTVEYEDPAYFSREYKKLFGEPPQRDFARLRTDLEI